jgi:hypothetical protein
LDQPPDLLTPELKDRLRLSDELIDEILAADHIAIGTPVYKYNIPAVLKAYIDHIVRRGRTLAFSGEGMILGKTCTILMASGGVYTEESPIRYLRLILRVIGIERVSRRGRKCKIRRHGADHARRVFAAIRDRDCGGSESLKAISSTQLIVTKLQVSFKITFFRIF